MTKKLKIRIRFLRSFDLLERQLMTALTMMNLQEAVAMIWQHTIWGNMQDKWKTYKKALEEE